jgi:predicted NBD/HSP70 family sugar kinase
MQYYVGLDISVKETSVCIVDKAGRVVREVKVATKPAAIRRERERDGDRAAELAGQRQRRELIPDLPKLVIAARC